MALHPDVQVRAQEELDAVIEADRLPTMADRSDEQLPYLKAVIKETMRWSPVLPLSECIFSTLRKALSDPVTLLIGIARRSDKADTYRGIDIPANTIIMPNSWYVYPLVESSRDLRFREGLLRSSPMLNIQRTSLYQNASSIPTILLQTPRHGFLASADGMFILLRLYSFQPLITMDVAFVPVNTSGRIQSSSS